MEARRVSPEHIVRADDILSQYISKFTLRGENVKEGRARKAFRWLLRFLAVVVGVVAGFPWIHTGTLAGSSSFILQLLIIAGVVIAYGLTTTWAFLQIVDKLKPEPVELNLMKAEKKSNSNIARHIFSHGFGLISTIPTLYIASIFNTGIYYVPVAGFVAYAFSTLGFYTLIEIVGEQANKVRYRHRRHSSTSQIREHLANNLSNKLVLQLRSGQFKAGIFNQGDIHSASDDTRQLLHLLKPEPLSEENVETIPSNKLTLALLIVAATLIALLNGVVNGLITFQAIGSLVDSSVLGIISSIVVAVPLLALDYLAIKSVLSSIKDTLNNAIAGKKSSSYTHNHRPGLYYVIPSAGFVLSVFSAMTDSYVTKNATEKSVLHAASLLFVINMQWSKTFLETIGVTTVMNDFIEWIDRKRNADIELESNIIDRVNDLSNVIRAADESVLSEFINKYRGEIEEITGGMESVNSVSNDVELYNDQSPLLFRNQKHLVRNESLSTPNQGNSSLVSSRKG